MEPEKYDCKKKAERDRPRLCRLRKKLEKGKQPPPSNETVEEENQTQTSTSFTSKQSLSRSIKKAEKALPFSQRIKKDVISGLAERYKLRIKYVERRGRKALIVEEKPDMITLNETKLTGNMTFSIDGYTSIVMNRPGRTIGGGIATLIKNNLKYSLSLIHI